MTTVSRALFLGTLVGLFAVSPAAYAQDKTIKIGALFPMSGPGSYFGAQDKQGVELALEQLNKAGVNGYKFVVQYEDSACGPLPAPQAAKRLIDQFKPDVIIGEECSDATLAVMPDGRAGESAAAQRRLIVDQGDRAGQSVDVPHHAERGDAGRRSRGERVKTHEGARPRCCCTRTPMPASATRRCSRRTSLSSAARCWRRSASAATSTTSPRSRRASRALGKVDVIPTYTLEGQGLKITQALAQAGVVKGGGGNAIQIGTIWLPFGFEQKAGKAALGYIRIVQFDPTDTRDVVKNFVAAFKAKYNADPTHLNAHAYDQIMLIADVVKRGGKDAQSIRDGLAATKRLSRASPAAWSSTRPTRTPRWTRSTTWRPSRTCRGKPEVELTGK